MAYVIAEPCIGTKDTACVDACPVDCIHPKKDEEKFEGAEMLYIDPVECIDCGAWVPVCPVSAAPRTRNFSAVSLYVFLCGRYVANDVSVSHTRT